MKILKKNDPKINNLLERLLFKDAKTRLVEFIKDLTDEQSDLSEDKMEVKHFYTHNDIANLIGTTRETVTKLFNQFKQEGLLEYSRRTIIINKKDDFLKLSSI